LLSDDKADIEHRDGLTPYRGFAQVYDRFMGDIPYQDWADYVEALWSKHSLSPKLVLELACGTGAMTAEMQRRGYEMIGADASADMLAMAKEKNPEILYLWQDMRSFELYGTVDAVLCVCDGLNYLLEEEDLCQTFRLVNNYLNPGGLFIFDMNTDYKFRRILADNTFAEAGKDASYIWENFYDTDEMLNTYDLQFFIKTSGGLFERFEECHCQRAYSVETVQKNLRLAGLALEVVYDAFTQSPPAEDSERLYFVARRT